MFGFPGETVQDIEQTIALLEEVQPYTAHCNIATPGASGAAAAPASPASQRSGR